MNIQTGFINLDRKTGGLKQGDLFLLCGKMGVGKSTFAIQVINICIDRKMPCHIFSMDLTKEFIINSIVSTRTGIRLVDIRSGNLSNKQHVDLVIEKAELMRMPLFIDDTEEYSIEGIRARLIRLNNTKVLSLVVIDQMENINDRSPSKITKELKKIIQELNIAVILICSMSGRHVYRKHYKPSIEDIRYSKAVCKPADIVAGIYLKESNISNGLPNDMKTAEIVLFKNKYGEIGPVELNFSLKTGRFYNKYSNELNEI